MIYVLDDGRVLFVTAGISRGIIPELRRWFTCYMHRGGAEWGLRRFKSPALPYRDTREEAQADLDRYAKKRGLGGA